MQPSNDKIMNTKDNKSELLLPAGNFERLKTAIMYGADAVYAGTPDMSLRTKSAFSLDELVEGVRYAHERGKRVYLTLNLFSHNSDIKKLPEFLKTISAVQPDGVIVADPGIFDMLKTHAPNVERHISTQANVCSSASVKFWKNQGASLVVLARELNHDEIAQIRRDVPDIKLETFIHGAMCMTYSGRCLLSNYLSEKGANQGSCAHSCRWNYKLKVRLKDNSEKEIEINEHTKELFEFLLEEECRPGQFLPFEEDVHGSYILNSKDLCLMPKLDQYLKIGIDSLKIEGRNKSQYYAGMVAKAYRHAIDDWYANPEGWSPEPYMNILTKISNRGYTLAFHEGRLSHLGHNYSTSRSVSDYCYAGHVTSHTSNGLVVEVRNEINPGDVMEFISPSTFDPIRLRLYTFIDADTQKQELKVSAGQAKRILIPYNWIHTVSESKLRILLPIGSLVTKEKVLDTEQKNRIKCDAEALYCESKHIPASKKWSYYQQAMLNAPHETTKAQAKGTMNRCCAKGCNGCLIFWNDPQYERLRKKIASKPLGSLL